MFAVNTEHAVKLDREPNGYMTWSILSVKLSWLGFEDFHSGISYYMINIGSMFMGIDLNKVNTTLNYQLLRPLTLKIHIQKVFVFNVKKIYC